MEAFYAGWLVRQEQLLHELLSAGRGASDTGDDDDDAALRELVSRTVAHHRSYYREKTRLADGDILLAYSPPWLSPFERTFVWIAGFRPSLVFRLLRTAAECSPEQALAVEELQAETAEEERRLGREMTALQEVMTTPLMAMARRRSVAAARNGEERAEEEEVMGPVLRSLRLLVERADGLRVRVVERLVEILRPAQTVELLAAAGELHLRIRWWGTRGRQATGGPGA